MYRLSEKHRTLKSVFVLLFLVFCVLFVRLFGLNVVFAAQNHDLRLVDEADLLSEKEKLSLISQLDEISEKFQQDVVIVTTYSLQGKTATEFADDYFDYHHYGFSDSRDGILLLVSMEYRDWAISTCGKSIEVFTDAGMEYMTGKFLPDISAGDYQSGFTKFAALTDKFFAQAEKGEPYDYNHLPKEPPAWYWLPITLVASAVIAYLIVSEMKRKLTSVKRKSFADDYIKENSFQLTEQNDLFLYRHTSVTQIPKNTGSGRNSSGGSGTHISSSGSTHGGSSGKF